ncbi:MAG: polynucleotide adenylyltransferase PcnB [Treponema sp.]|nr:polynucleotide adenylyltransferase PcnB [Treponema sp.]
MLVRYGTDEKGRPVKKAVVYTKEEHKIPLSAIDSDALYIINQLKENGFDSYIVGGAVRDLIGNRKPKDFDIVTDATPSRIKKIFRNSRIIGKRFRLVHVFFGEKIFEVSTFRSICDGSVGNAFGSMDEDVMRRDFTLNALYYDPLKEHVIDYVDGIKDIKKGVVTPVIPLDRIFIEDPVRMLRAVKYGATTGCKLPRKLKKKILESSALLSPVSPSRLTEELLKIINSGHSRDIVSAALDTDLYIYLQPAATNLMQENKTYAKQYMESLEQLDALVKENPESKLGERLYYILKDFVAQLTDWEKEKKSSSAAELYKRTWAICRNFVLPMNPQRTELDFAVREVLVDLGIQLKKKPRPRRAVRKTAEEK